MNPSTTLFEILDYLGLPKVNGIFQVGANVGQEVPLFLENKVSCAFLVEPQDHIFPILAEKVLNIPDFHPIKALLAEQSGLEVVLNVASNEGGSSSILDPEGHKKIWPFIKFEQTQNHVTTTLDRLYEEISIGVWREKLSFVDTLYMDTQGYEYNILLGASNFLRKINYIYSEHFREVFYNNSRPLTDYVKLLEGNGFTLNNINYNRSHHAEMFFVRRSLIGL